MTDHPQSQPPANTIDPCTLWRRSIENLREARRQAPIMMDFEGRDGRTRDAAAEAYVTAAEALVIDLGTLLELGQLEAVEECMTLGGSWRIPA